MKLTLAFASIALFLTLPTSVFAQTQSFETEQEEFLIQTSSGKIISESIVVKSKSSGSLTLEASWQPYSTSKHSIDFVTLSQSKLELQPQSVQVIEVNFTVPAKIVSGDYYGALVLKNSVEETRVSFTVRVLGTLSEKITLKSFSKKGSEINLEVVNEGNKTTSLYSTIKISDVLGQIDEVKIQPTKIKAGETAILKDRHKLILPGYYQATVSLTYGDKETSTTSVHSFWVLPWFFAAVTGVVLIILVAAVRKRVTRA